MQAVTWNRPTPGAPEEFGAIVSLLDGGESPESRVSLTFIQFAKNLLLRRLPRDPCARMGLKNEGDRADGRCMFMPCFEDLGAAESAFLGFRASLNTPVVNVEDLDVGPARAGILLSAGEYGDLKLLVRVRLISTGEGMTFRFQGNPAEFGDARSAVDAAIGFGEGMGFLFDDDLVIDGGPSGRSRAFKIWSSLTRNAEHVATVASAEPPAAPTQQPAPVMANNPAPAGELELTDDLVVELASASDSIRQGAQPNSSETQTFFGTEGPVGAARPVPSAGRPAAEKANAPRQGASEANVLTKFRQLPRSERRGAATDRRKRGAASTAVRPDSKELAGIELASEELGNEFVDVSGFLTRLLSSF